MLLAGAAREGADLQKRLQLSVAAAAEEKDRVFIGRSGAQERHPLVPRLRQEQAPAVGGVVEGAAHDLALSRAVVIAPEDAVVGLALLIERREGDRLGDLDHAAAVDVGRIEREEAEAAVRGGGGGVLRDIAQNAVFHGQDIVGRHAVIRHAGDVERLLPIRKSARRHARKLGRREGQLERRDAAQLAVVPGVAVRHAAVLLAAVEHRQLLPAVTVEIAHGVAEVGGGEQVERLAAAQGVNGEHLQLRAALEADKDLAAAVAVEVIVRDGVDRAGGPLDEGHLLVAVAVGAEEVDLHGPLVRRLAEEGHRLLYAVAVEIDHLHALEVTARDGRSVLRAVGEQGVDLRFERGVFRRKARQGIELVGRDVRRAAAEQQAKRRKRQRAGKFSAVVRHAFPSLDPLWAYSTDTEYSIAQAA